MRIVGSLAQFLYHVVVAVESCPVKISIRVISLEHIAFRPSGVRKSHVATMSHNCCQRAVPPAHGRERIRASRGRQRSVASILERHIENYCIEQGRCRLVGLCRIFVAASRPCCSSLFCPYPIYPNACFQTPQLLFLVCSVR